MLYADDLSHARTCACCGEPVERETDIVTCAACGHSDDVKANAAARLWQQEQGRYAEAAAQAQHAIREAREAAALKQREKLARMAEKRIAVNPVSDGAAALGTTPETA